MKVMQLIGRSDRVDLPELGLSNIHAKIDTGAYTGSLHCSKAEVSNGRLEFVVLDEEHPEFTGMKFTVRDYSMKEVKNSFGVTEQRFVIRTVVRMFGEDIDAELTLSDRDELKFPILLGRKLLRHRFHVDVTKKNLSYKQKIRARKQKKAKAR